MSYSPTKIPSKISLELSTQCRKFVGNDDIQYLDILERPNSRINKCAYNAKEEAERINGKIVFGWSITVWDSVLIELIGHAIVDDGEKRYCVTPSKYNEKQVLFVVDDSISFDFDNSESRLPSRKLAVSKHKSVKRFIEIQQQIHAIKVKYPITSGLLSLGEEDSKNISDLEKKSKEATYEVIYFHHPIKTPCFCGSGKQFRKCCKPQMKRVYG